MNGSAPQASPARILLATGAALIVAALVMVIAVLPAEYGIDPTGAGRVLGLTRLAQVPPEGPPSAPAVPNSHSSPMQHDTYTVELRPFEGVEYKYRLEQDAALVYEWEATAVVSYEFHGEPDGAPAKYFDSYAKGSADRAQGGFAAAKPGIHGWFWKNTGTTPVTVRLRTAGFYATSTEYRDGERVGRSFKALSK